MVESFIQRGSELEKYNRNFNHLYLLIDQSKLECSNSKISKFLRMITKKFFVPLDITIVDLKKMNYCMNRLERLTNFPTEIHKQLSREFDVRFYSKNTLFTLMKTFGFTRSHGRISAFYKK